MKKPETFLEVLKRTNIEKLFPPGISPGTAAQGVKPAGAGATDSIEFGFATGIECSNPVIADENGDRVRRDLLDECGHYKRWREDLQLVKEMNIPLLRYGLPNHRIHLGPDRYDWSFADEALAEISRAEALDPVSLITNTNEGWILFCARQYDQAIQKLQATIEMDPNFANVHYKLALVYEIKGMYKEAVEEHLKSKALSGDNPENVEKLKAAYATSGAKGYYREELRQLKETSSRGYVLPKYFVLTELQLGNTEETFKWLEQAYKERTELLVYLRVDPRSDSLRSDPHFVDMLRRVNLAL